jgi:predicted RNase H-like nuclease (RuvC/YqgF family)
VLDSSLSKREIIELASELDKRRQAQIKHQIAVINRLIAGPRTYDEEMEELHVRLAERDCIIEQLRSQLEDYRRRYEGSAGEVPGSVAGTIVGSGGT